MRVLFLTTRLPVPPRRGDQVRAFHQLRLLAPRHRITLVLLALRPPARRDLLATQALGVEVAVHPVGRGLPCALTRGLRDPRPLQVLLYLRSRVVKALAARYAGEHVDVVHAQLVRTAPYVAALRAPAVVDLIDALSLTFERRAALGTWGLRPLARLEAHRLRAFERTLVDSVATCLVVADADRQALASPRVEVVPNGVDAEVFAFREDGRRTAEIVFAGNLGYFPNVDAAERLVCDILPRVRERIPAARLRLVGARPNARVRRLAGRPGVEVVGPVDDMAAELWRASLAVIPIRAGSGLQNKVLEAMAAGTPVVTTPGCATAVSAVPGVHLATATEAADLASAAVSLLEQPRVGRELARAARALIEREWSWDRAAAGLERVWARAAG